MLTILKFKCKGKVGKRFWTLILDPDYGPQFETPIWDPIWDPNLVPRFGTLIWGVIWDPDGHMQC
jgi:hypothetical protein